MSYFRPPFSPETPQNTLPPAKRLTRLEGYAMSSLSAGMGIAYMAAGIEPGSVWREIIFGLGILGLLTGTALFVLSGIRRIQRRRHQSSPRSTARIEDDWPADFSPRRRTLRRYYCLGNNDR
jgi:threonine dehydrogenase-like Zn-dependent dehydrogenase